MIRILIKNNLSKFHLDESFANLIRPKIKQILTNQYDLFNNKEKNKLKKTHDKKNTNNLNLNISIKDLLKNYDDILTLEISLPKGNKNKSNLEKERKILSKLIIQEYKKNIWWNKNN